MTDQAESGERQPAPPAKSHLADLAVKLAAGVVLLVVGGSATAILAHESRLGAVESQRASEATARKDLRASETKAHDKQHEAIGKSLDEIKADIKKLLEAR